MTGWGQDGPLAREAGHDINYIALAGVLAHIGRAGAPPTPPLNLVGDYGGGGMFLAFGIVCALLEARASGQGQVVDAAMVDGAAALMAPFWGFRATGLCTEDRGHNLLDSGAHFYDVYETADGRFLSVGAIEPQFYAELLRGLGLEGEDLPRQMDKSSWPALKERFAAIIATKTRAEWCAVFDGTDACVAPVLTMSEAMADDHVAARDTIVVDDGIAQPAPAPGSRARRARSRDRHPSSVPTPTRCWPTGASPSRSSRDCTRPVPSRRPSRSLPPSPAGPESRQPATSARSASTCACR